MDEFRRRLLAMRDEMVHRGPDDEGIFVSQNGCVGLANRRLAIRDLSPAGHMPMSNCEGTVWITYNGEIYNTDELRPELEKLGYHFNSHSDTEVILHGYEAWGVEVVNRLRGMFAFAIYDCRESGVRARLFLVRDRIGIKPLYYEANDKKIVFASELKALIVSKLVCGKVCPIAFAAYLMMGSVPSPMTIYREIKALEPGTYLLWQDGRVEIRRYWTLPVEIEGNDENAVERVRELIEEAVRIRMVSDVPLGAFLSGGLDSSAVVALMRQATNSTIRTCSMVFEEADYNEAFYARAMAEAVGADHYERVITAGDIKSELDRFVAFMDQPTLDGINTYFVAQTARQAGLTVAMSGLGGDELFGGYTNTFRGVPVLLQALELLYLMPTASRAAKGVISLFTNRRRWAKITDALGRPPSPSSAYFARRGVFSSTEVKELVKTEVWQAAGQAFNPISYIAERADHTGPRRKRNGLGRSSMFSWVSRAELATYTHNQLLRDTDVMSMANSLEVRVPLLDHRLVEAVLRMPERGKRIGPGSKPLLTSALGDRLPAVIRKRGEKLGFTFPFDRWMRESLHSIIEDAILSTDQNGQQLLRPGAARSVWELYLAGKLHWSRPWALVAFSLWQRSVAC